MIVPNTQKIYSAPSYYLDHFVVNGRRYFKTPARCLISDFGRYGFLPPIDRGLYLKISTKDFNIAKALYQSEKKKFMDRLNGNLNKGVKLTLF
jgi:hypothetical protein